MKHRLFKKFASIDFNEYYYAVVNGEVYYGVSSLFNYKDKMLGIGIKRTEEQYFHTMKLPEIVVNALLRFSEDDNFDIKRVKKDIKDLMYSLTVKTYTELGDAYPDKKEEYATQGASKLLGIEALFKHTWKNPLIRDYVSKEWSFLFEEYSGRATRTVWLIRTHDDIINILSIKLFGDEKENEVIEVKRLLMDKELSIKFLEKIEKGE